MSAPADTFTFDVVTSYTVTRDDVECIVEDALAFGGVSVGGWFQVFDLPKRDGWKVVTWECPNGYGWVGTPLVHYINHADIVAAIPKAAAKLYGGVPVADIINCGQHHDSVSDDAVLQMATLGDIVFG
ncbi:MAG: hypothetical protein CL581_10980 [Alteromonadaceae bacterium]|nr:hypothetical protein [Alteromonadaceae bacterium]